MSLGISISPASDVPIFRQVMHHIQRGVFMGKLEVGAQLPTVRALAEELVINPNTVARAYQELIREGLLESRAGIGVFVTERRQVFSQEEQARRLKEVAEQLCYEAKLQEATLPQVHRLIDDTWQSLQQKNPTKKKP
jgi:GntR family transcriptional regulator